MLTPICMLCVVHMISFNNWYETPLLPTEFADARWRNKTLLLHPNVRAQHVHLVCVRDTQRCCKKIIIKEKNPITYWFIILVGWSIFIDPTHWKPKPGIFYVCVYWQALLWKTSSAAAFMMRQCCTFSFVSLLFITLYLTNVLVSVTSALFVRYDEAERASSRRHDESQWKIFQLVTFRLLQCDSKTQLTSSDRHILQAHMHTIQMSHIGLIQELHFP